MSRLLLMFLLLAGFSVAPQAQQRKTTAKKTVVRKTATKRPVKKTTRKSSGKSVSSPEVSNKNIESLKSQRQQVQQRIKAQEARRRQIESDVRKRMQNLQILNGEIADKRRTIDTIRKDITRISGNIAVLNEQLKELQGELENRKREYVKSMYYLHRNRSVQSQLMFVFSAQNFTQMFRRLRFTREYASFQKAQGEAVKIKQEEVGRTHNQLLSTKRQKDDLLRRGEQEHRQLEGKQNEQQKVVNSLQNEQKTIQKVIAEQKKKDTELNAQIDRLIAIEIAKAKARAEAEAKKKAAEEAARKRAEELARKKAAEEAAAREKENARRIAEAKAREEKAKAAARAAARKSALEKAEAERAAQEAERERLEMERKAAEEARLREKKMAEARKASAETFVTSSEDRRISGSFESNKGRLPMPLTGGYRIVTRFGRYNVEGLKGVTLDNKGINIKGQPGAQARSIFDGEVSAVFGYAGQMGVIVRHGSYLSVYCNLSSVSVRRGQQVSTRQVLGSIGGEGILQFQLRRGNDKLNPENWLGR